MILVSQERARDFKAKGWWGERRLFDWFDEHVRAKPAAEACIDPPNIKAVLGVPPRQLNWRTLDDQVMRLIAVLYDRGLRKDDIILVQLPNSIEIIIVYLACMKLGMVVTPVPVQYREHELAQVVELTAAKAVITGVQIGKHKHAEMFLRLLHRMPTVQSIFSFGGSVLGTHDVQQLINDVGQDARTSAAQGIAAAVVTADDVVTICWTSGTEAAPKGVPRSHNEWIVMGEMVIAAALLEPGARMLNPFPMINMAGLSTGLVNWLLLGGVAVQHQPFDLDVFLQQVRDEKIEYTVAPPAVLNRLLQNEHLLAGIDFKRLSRLGSGSAPLSEWMVRTWYDRYGVAVINYFGSNEGASFAGTLADIPDPGERAMFFPRFGPPHLKWDFAMADRVATRLVEPGTRTEIATVGGQGELQVKGAGIFSGYWRAPEQTARAFDDGWYCTGDLFELAGDHGQYYRFLGRLKDVIVRGGVKISAEEIEGHLAGHPKIAEAAVIGVPDPVLGERICACVVPRSEAPSREEVNRFLIVDKQIALYKQIERLEIISALPRNPVGKIVKRELRAQLADAATA